MILEPTTRCTGLPQALSSVISPPPLNGLTTENLGQVFSAVASASGAAEYLNDCTSPGLRFLRNPNLRLLGDDLKRDSRHCFADLWSERLVRESKDGMRLTEQEAEIFSILKTELQELMRHPSIRSGYAPDYVYLNMIRTQPGDRGETRVSAMSYPAFQVVDYTASTSKRFFAVLAHELVHCAQPSVMHIMNSGDAKLTHPVNIGSLFFLMDGKLVDHWCYEGLSDGLTELFADLLRHSVRKKYAGGRGAIPGLGECEYDNIRPELSAFVVGLALAIAGERGEKFEDTLFGMFRCNLVGGVSLYEDLREFLGEDVFARLSGVTASDISTLLALVDATPKLCHLNRVLKSNVLTAHFIEEHMNSVLSEVS